MHERINFNQNTLNIFTDASVILADYGFDSCSASFAIIGDDEENAISKVEINRNTTNNFGEMYAIYLGVLTAYEFTRTKHFDIVNVFSDSAVSVFGLKEWIYNWKLDKDGLLINSSNKPVANQSLICNIIDIILTFNLNISFFHIKGHTEYNDSNKIQVLNKFISKFRNLNKDIGYGLIDYSTIRKLIEYNDYVDNMSRDYLKSSDELIYEYPFQKCFDPKWNLEKYRELIKPSS